VTLNSFFKLSGLFYDDFSIASNGIRFMMDHDLETTWKAKLRHHPGFTWKVEEKPRKTCQDSQCPSRNSNTVPSKYKQRYNGSGEQFVVSMSGDRTCNRRKSSSEWFI
jgi:hypothetical protein